MHNRVRSIQGLIYKSSLLKMAIDDYVHELTFPRRHNISGRREYLESSKKAIMGAGTWKADEPP